ncbi:hypothetical protein [Micromonospora sp. NBC_01796]|uniref:hypothetical protein n=1 Tax=Micromonospora sp. NBC_01796 TaxID=2975987 RepID=UPI002DDAA2D0|nr:hypothetical protein [Micromonospora sp. NBC_01796]WSA88790.1 hypothetical protein OIE47_14930 [Micromonospora sp. NBC_01796]
MLLTSAAILAVGVPAAPAGAQRELRQDPAEARGLGLQLLDIPVSRAEDPRARAYIIDHLKPGTTIHRRVEVRNSSPERQHVELYAGAASVERNSFTVPDGREGNELSRWVSLESSSVDLPPGARTVVPVTVAVPRTASKGERYGAVWAQITRAPTQQDNVGQIHRVGIRMYLDIGAGGEPPTDFRIEGLAAARGDGEWPVVTAQVHNTGGRALDLGGSLSLVSRSGTVKAGPFAVKTGVTILPGQRAQVSALVDQPLSAGQWDARMTLFSGTVERTGEGSVMLPGMVTAQVEPGGRGTLVLSLSVGAAIALLLVVAAVVWYLVRRERRRSGAVPG